MLENSTQLQEIRTWPKAEPHVHFEGTVSPLLLRDLARNNQVDLFSPVKAPIGARFFNPEVMERFVGGDSFFTNFVDFISVYLKVSECLATARDILEAGEHYLEQLKAESIVAADCYFSPTTFAMFGRNIPTLFDALKEFTHAASSSDVTLQWIFDIVRNVSADGMEMFAFFDLAKSRGLSVQYLGLAGDESTRGPEHFVKAFELARKRNLRTLVHTGESGSPEQVLQAIKLLKPERIGHGICALDHSHLQELLTSSQLPIEVAPWSNILLRFATRNAHPIAAMIKTGLNVIPASDDPGILNKSLSANYLFALEQGVSLAQLREIARQSVRIVRGI